MALEATPYPEVDVNISLAFTVPSRAFAHMLAEIVKQLPLTASVEFEVREVISNLSGEGAHTLDDDCARCEGTCGHHPGPNQQNESE